MTDDTAQWHSTHVYYYARDRHDDVILDALGPLLDDVSGAVAGGYFERHWLRGPHLRLHVRAPAEAWTTEVRPSIERKVGRYLWERPSTAVVDVAAALSEHRLLSELEREVGPLTPWFPDNTLRFVPYDWRQHVLGSRTAAELLADFHSDATVTLLTMLHRIRQGESRPGMCLNLMFALAHVGCPPITRGFISYRSHVEYFLTNCRDPDGMRKKFERRYLANRSGLIERLNHLLDLLDSGDARGKGDADVSFIREWVQLWQRYQQRGEKLLSTGEMDLETAAASPPEQTRISSFQQGLEDTGAWQEIRHALWFRSYRLLLNCTYLQMNRLGCTPVERYLLCYLVSRTVEDRFDVLALDQAKELS